MRFFLSLVSASVLFFSSLVAVAGDCNKTVMGGGCSGQVEGVSPHMQSQNPLNAATKAKVSTAAPAPASKAAAPAKNQKVSNAAGQKPQI